MKNILKKTTRPYLEKISKPLSSVIYNYNDKRLSKENLEGYFETTDGRKIPILKNHRYSLKKTWQMFGPLSALNELNKKNLLEKKDEKFFENAIGYRTIQSSMHEIRDVLKPYLDKYSDIFLSTDIPDLSSRVLKANKFDVETTIKNKISGHKNFFQKIRDMFPDFKLEKSKILEIGYTSGGESIIAFERLGLDAYGIDYNYDGNFETNSRHLQVSELAKSKATFLQGDITKKTEIDSESLDIIYTLSVLEHIKNIPAAFEEMYRILKPGGIMYHRYDPYFHIKGGHPPCMLDSPWAHMRMSEPDVERYIQELRPYEAPSVIPWIKNALNRNHTQNYVQINLVKAGFKIYWWQNLEVPTEHKSMLDPEIISDALCLHDDVSLSDLISHAVAFIAVKPR